MSDPTSNPKTVAGCLEESFETIGQLVSSVEMPESPHQPPASNQTVRSNDQSKTEAASTIQKVSKLLPVLLQALDHLGEINQDKSLEASVIYKFVKMFENALRLVCELSAYGGQVRVTSDPCVPSRVNGRQVEEAESRDSTKVSFRQSRTILDLCELNIAMTTALKPTKPMQARMLEGCLSILLTRVGRGLKSCLFGVTDHDTIDDQTRDPERDQEEADHALEAQGPYLIFILERVPKPMDSGSLQPSGSALLRSAKKKLQNSLLNSVFGETALGLIKPSLELPKPPTNLHHFAGVEAVEVRNWYKSEAWKLVGWEVLDDYLRMPIQKLRNTACT